MKKVGFCFGPYHECSGFDDCTTRPIARAQEAIGYAGAVTLEKEIRKMTDEVREFDTGATRSSSEDRYDPEGYLSPIVEERFCEYMLRHQYQADGTKRDSDNWQKGMPLETYMQGLKRHVLHLWTRHRGYHVLDDNAGINIEEDLCAILFNAQGYLHSLLAKRQARLKNPLISIDAGGLASDATGFANVYISADPTAPVRRIEEETWTTDETKAAEPDSLVEAPYNAQWTGPRKDER